MNRLLALCLLLSGALCPGFAQQYKDEHIRYGPVRLSPDDRRILETSLGKLHGRYDPQEKMITKTLTGYNYHTDAETGVFHEVRASFNYAMGLLDLGEERYHQRAFDIIRKTISLQDTVRTSRTFGIWPYYMEEPLATKKSPADWNWADFNGVSLLDMYMGHYQIIPAGLKASIRKSLIDAAESIQKRDVQPSYTNIAIMGTYMTYLTAHLFDLPELKQYANNRLNKFYNYTLERGFTEYNSPTYTIVALNELSRMQAHIVDKQARPKIDSLYNIGWEVIARHFHQPSGQWAGPHSRVYSSLPMASVYGVLKQASNGKINLPGAVPPNDIKVKHHLPEYLLPYFLAPHYPRTQTDVLAIDEPQIIGTTYLTDHFALSSANRSSLWNQRRPFLAYWGTPREPHYLQARFLHDGYDFSSASFYSVQHENDILAAITFLTNGGDKHISIDRLKDGKITAKDLRLRFEFGNVPADKLPLPDSGNEPFAVHVDGLSFQFNLFQAVFDSTKGHWEKGGEGTTSWIDYVVYSGPAKEINLAEIDEAVLGFTFSLQLADAKPALETPQVSHANGALTAKWKSLSLSVSPKPGPQPKNL